MRVVPLVLGLTAFLVACGAFGDSKESASVSPQRSVTCADKICTGDDFCCLNGGGEGTCALSCPERTFVCNDRADCASGLVCCVDVNANADGSAIVQGSACSTPETCQDTAPGAGAKKFRGCDARGADCDGLGCKQLSSRYPTVFPSSQIFVCQ